LELGAESGYIRIFADEGPRLCQLFEKYRFQLNAVGPYLEMLLSIMGKPEPIVSETIYAPNDLVPLTRRELDVLHQLAVGKSNQEIADELVLALNTVKKHVANIIRKLGVANRTQAVMLAREKGWLE
jgi:DNA-binding NarL/FixJ family response regulator